MNMNRRQLLIGGAAVGAGAVLPGCGAGDYPVTIDNSLPVGEFGANSTAEDVTDGLDLSGRVILVTGCNSGLGLETLRVLALRGAHVLGTGRTMEKAARACESVEGKATPLVLELSDFQSCVDCAAAIAELGVVPDTLVLNAGINTFGEL